MSTRPSTKDRLNAVYKMQATRSAALNHANETVRRLELEMLASNIIVTALCNDATTVNVRLNYASVSEFIHMVEHCLGGTVAEATGENAQDNDRWNKVYQIKF